MTVTDTPVHVDAALDPNLSRWLWLVKWLLVIPHLLVLMLLWTAFAVLSVAAFFAILLTGRYPRSIFEFNVGVLRWTWRVAFYTYGALATDHYPPFTLDDVPDYPARLRVDYPGHLSRGLVLVKWWLLAIPHYLVLGFFLGGGFWFADEVGEGGGGPGVWGFGLAGLLVLIAAVVLLFTGRYPQPIFDLVLGIQRWVLRVAAYAGLMTDAYPPFRLDLGGVEPTPAHLAVTRADPDTAPADGASESGRPRQHDSSGWTAGRTVSVVIGSLATMLALGIFAAAGVAVFVDRVARDDVGFVTLPEQTVQTSTYALASETVAVRGPGAVLERVVGRTRVRVSAGGEAPVFVGIAPTADVRRYLDTASHTTVVGSGPGGEPIYRDHRGGALAAAPTEVPIWAAQTSGTGTQALAWMPKIGDWTLVVMNSDGHRGVGVVADIGARLPMLGWITAWLFVAASAFLTVGLVLTVLAVRGRARASS